MAYVFANVTDESYNYRTLLVKQKNAKEIWSLFSNIKKTTEYKSMKTGSTIEKGLIKMRMEIVFKANNCFKLYLGSSIGFLVDISQLIIAMIDGHHYTGKVCLILFN